MIPHRKTPDRESRYMGLAFWISAFSKDPSTQVGAIIVSDDNRPLGTGYNGPPSEMNDLLLNWGREPDATGLTKYDVVVHAEINAINHSHGNLKGSTLYVTAMPCPNCMIDIVNWKISRVVYFPFCPKDGKSSINSVNHTKSLNLARTGNVAVKKFTGDLSWIKEQVSLWESLGILDI